MRGLVWILIVSTLTATADWRQGAGPNFDYSVDNSGPLAFSASANLGIAWQVPLPETGQSSPIITGGKIFLTCFEPVKADSKTGRDLLALCLDQENGELLWQRPLPGEHESRISGCFGDNSKPAAVSDGKSVAFFNAGGRIHKYDLDGDLLWSANLRHSTRSDPYLLGDLLVVNGSADSHTAVGRHLRGIDWQTGERRWESANLSWESTTSMPYRSADGSWVALIARGGGHAKGKFRDGVSLIDLADGSERWERPMPHLRSTQNYRLQDQRAFVFLANGRHLVLDLETGEPLREDKLLSDPQVDLFTKGAYRYGGFEKPLNCRKRTIIQMSNLLVGDYHYFRTYVGSFLGRVHIHTGKAEFLHLPGKVQRDASKTLLGWGKRMPENAMRNTAGHRVCGDERSVRNGWGHTTSALPTVCGQHLYVPTMCGLVYVLRWNVDRLDHQALISISDLGTLGDSWNRSSIVFSDGHLYARTIKQLLCISGCRPEDLP